MMNPSCTVAARMIPSYIISDSISPSSSIGTGGDRTPPAFAFSVHLAKFWKCDPVLWCWPGMLNREAPTSYKIIYSGVDEKPEGADK